MSHTTQSGALRGLLAHVRVTAAEAVHDAAGAAAAAEAGSHPVNADPRAIAPLAAGLD